VRCPGLRPVFEVRNYRGPSDLRAAGDGAPPVIGGVMDAKPYAKTLYVAQCSDRFLSEW